MPAFAASAAPPASAAQAATVFYETIRVKLFEWLWSKANLPKLKPAASAALLVPAIRNGVLGH